MDAVKKFRLKRINRLEKRFGPRNGLVRFDDDEETNTNNNPKKGGGGGHGNTRIPFGLCQREGITIESGWTPTDAWSALEGKGYSASSVYKQLSKTGKLSSKGTDIESYTFPVSIKKDKPKIDVSEQMTFIGKYKKDSKTYERLKKQQDKLDREIKEAEKEKSARERSIERSKNTIERLIERYGSVENITDESARRQYRIENMGISFSEDRIKENAETIKKSSEKKAKVDSKIEKLGFAEDKEKYDKAANEILENSPHTKSVMEYRGIEEDVRDSRKELAKIDEKIALDKSTIESFTPRLEKARKEGKDWATEAYEAQINMANNSLKKLEEKRVSVAEEVEKADKKIESLKKDVNEDDWNLVYDLSIERDTVQDGPYTELEDSVRKLREQHVEYLNPVKLTKPMDEERIINSLGGGDKTKGSCVSLSFAYVANKGGYDVLDFRGGNSQTVFSYGWHGIVGKLGGDSESGRNDIECCHKLFDKMESGKEYILATGRHAAVVKKSDDGIKYLELQSTSGNGWFYLTDGELKSRFKAKERRPSDGKTSLIESSKCLESKEFISIMGYINTKSEKQRKGFGGGRK